MKRILYICIISGMLLSWMVSCAPVHRPTVINAPLMKKRGDLQLSGHSSVAGHQVNGAVAVSDHVGVVVNSVVAGSGQSEQEKNGRKVSIDNEMRQIEGGLGFFNAFDFNVVVELYGGFGYGYSKTLSDTGTYPDKVEARGYRYYAQPALGYSGDFFVAGLATRVLYLDLYDYHDHSNGDTSGHTGLFYEPAVFVRLGVKSVKVESQIGLSMRDRGDIDYVPILFSIGAHFSVNLFSL